jgi:hypothetical protein
MRAVWVRKQTKDKKMKRTVIQFMGTVGCLLAFSSGAPAASITWGVATTLVGDSDVSTNGTSVFAANFDTGAASVLVNGVTFVGGGTTTTMRNSTLYGDHLTYDNSYLSSSPSAFTTTSDPYASLSTDYKALLDGAVYGTTDSVTKTFTLGNLTLGQQYLVQVWAQDPRSGTGRNTTVGGVTLANNSVNTVGGLGQYVIGTFVADASTQDFVVSSTLGLTLNAMQVRAIVSRSLSLSVMTSY